MTRQESIAFIEAVVRLRNLVDDSLAVQVPNIYPSWKPNTEYTSGDRVVYQNELYKALINHTSETEIDTIYFEKL